jgi:recombination protein U
MNYPNGIKKKKNQPIPIKYDNRGMNLEEEINISNNFYLEKNIAIIYKKPTPIRIVKVDYSTNRKPIIKEAFFEKPSTTDYNGLYKGYYIDFDAKETNNTSKLPLANIHKHQLDHLRRVYEHGGISFLIVRFNKSYETYVILGKQLLDYIQNNSIKYISKTFFDKKCYKISYNYLNKLDYLKIIDKILEEKNEKDQKEKD